MPSATNYTTEKKELLGVNVTVTTYQVGEQFFCHVQNQDPGATIARGKGADAEEAKQKALDKATTRLQVTAAG